MVTMLPFQAINEAARHGAMRIKYHFFFYPLLVGGMNDNENSIKYKMKWFIWATLRSFITTSEV
jgi:hypothetical protein